VPAKATQAEIQLRLRWAANGEVQFRDIELKETAAPAPRQVKVASINHRPRNSKSAQTNLEQFAKLIDEAGAQKVDIICLPEGITVCGTRFTYADVAEPIPGPATQFLGQCAARNKAWIVAGLYEREGKSIYNTSVLLSRDGKLAGKYRKVCLPREEIDAGITPGHEYPVFDTDFGRIGMMICWDISYPEVARELSARGAEMIFMPIWGGNETLAKARAIENQIYLVASGYDFRTAIYNKAGEELAKSPDSTNVIYANIDLNQRLLWPWLGDWRSRIWLEGPARAEVK
jgi:predicted amidohydrolase